MLPSLLKRPTEQPVQDGLQQDALRLLDGGMVFDDEGHLQHYWFHLQQREETFYKVVILQALSFLPREVREQMTVLEKMRKVLRGLWNGSISLIYLAAGIFPQPGIVQCYGSQGQGTTLEEAQGRALAGSASLLAAMANYEQARLEPLTVDVATWLRGALSEMHFATTVIGQPDPRTEGSRGMGSGEGPSPQHGQVGLQQNEMLLRGFASRREPFLELVLITPVGMADITRLQERVAHEASIWASKVHFTRSISAGISIPMILSGQATDSGSQSYGTAEQYGVSDAVGEARAVSRGSADQVSEGHSVTDTVGQSWGSSQASGSSVVVSRGQSHTVGFADGVSQSHSEGGSVTQGTAHTEGQALTQGVSHTEGQAVTAGVAHSEGQASTVGSAHTEGQAATLGSGHSVGQATTQGQAHSEGVAQSQTQSLGGSQSWSTAVGQSETHGVADTNSWSHTDSVSDGVSQASGVASTQGQSHQEGGSWSTGGSASAGVQGSLAPGGVGVGASVGASVSGSVGGSWSDSSMSSVTQSESTSQSHVVGQADTVGGAHTVSQSLGSSLTQSEGGSRSWSASEGITRSAADTLSQAQTQSVADTVSQSQTRSAADTLSQAQTQSVGDTVSRSQSRSAADTVSQAATRSASDTVSQSAGRNWADTAGSSQTNSISDGVSDGIAIGRSASSSQSQGGTVSHAESLTQGSSHTVSEGLSKTSSLQHGNSHSVGSSMGQSLGWARGLGLSAGLAPSLSFGKSYMGEDHVAALVAQALGQQELILQTMSLEGGLLVDHYILTASPEGRQMAETLVPQAFHGTEEVATPVRTRRLAPDTERYIRTRANLFTPSTRAERSPWALEPWADSSLLTMLQASSYVAPGVFEEGLAVTTQERVPPFAFRADMRGDVVLGHFISYETGNVTGAPLRLAREKMANWAFAADTGYGKTVAAERLVLESTRQWKVRTVVGDFGAGWRKLLSLLPGHSTLYGLYPGSPRPLRWNPLQIGRRITPEIQLAATCELLVNAGRMGQRQHGWLRQHLRALYQEHGVLVEDREVWAHDRWGKVSAEERELLDQARGAQGMNPLTDDRMPLSRLQPWERQLLAVRRSMAVDLLLLYGSLDRQFQKLRPGSPDHTSMQGLLLRLEAFTQGETARMYGRGEGCIAIEDLSLPWGLTILEGGRLSDEYAKAVILGLITWHLYTDAVIRREEAIGDPGSNTPLHLVLEEANKILSGVGGEEDPRQATTSELLQRMWRDARKYAIWLTAIVQSPSLLAPGILSSCNNLVVGQLKADLDRKAVLAALARMVTGFHDQDYIRYLGRMAVAEMVLKLGVSQRRQDLEPMLFRPLMVQAPEPTNDEIGRAFGDADLTRS